jgi:acylphosphatase
MTTLQLAEGLPLAGTVRNTDDGDVELIVEGEGTVIETLIQRLREHFGSFIRTMTQSTSRATGLRGDGIRIVH